MLGNTHFNIVIQFRRMQNAFGDDRWLPIKIQRGKWLRESRKFLRKFRHLERLKFTANRVTDEGINDPFQSWREYIISIRRHEQAWKFIREKFPCFISLNDRKKRKVAKEDEVEGYTSDLISCARSCARNDKFIILRLSETCRAANLYKCKSRSRNVLPFL